MLHSPPRRAWPVEGPRSRRPGWLLPLVFVAGGVTFLGLPSLLARGADAGDQAAPRRTPTGPPVGYRDTGPADLIRASDARSALARIAPDARGVTFETSADGRAQFILNRRTTPSAPEQHADWDDLFIIQSGRGMAYYGGKLSGAEARNPKELVGGRLDEALSVALGPGDVLRVPAGLPHVIAPLGDAPLVYLVVKHRAPEKRIVPAAPTVEAPPARGSGWRAKPSAAPADSLEARKP